MEMNCWQYWDAVKDNIEKGKTGMRCLECEYDFSKRLMLKRFGNSFRPCPKCGGQVRFYHKKIKKKRRLKKRNK